MVTSLGKLERAHEGGTRDGCRVLVVVSTVRKAAALVSWSRFTLAFRPGFALKSFLSLGPFFFCKQ